MCRCIYSIKKYIYIFIYNYISPQVSPKIGVFWATTFSPLTSNLSLSTYISHIFSCDSVDVWYSPILKIVMFYSSLITHSSYLSSSTCCADVALMLRTLHPTLYPLHHFTLSHRNMCCFGYLFHSH